MEDPNEFVLVEAFKDDAAGDHVNSAHFQKAMADMPQALAETPRIISRQLDGEGWDRMGELTICLVVKDGAACGSDGLSSTFSWGTSTA